MPEEKKTTLWNEQKITRPKIDEIIPDVSDAGIRKTVSEFVLFLRENKMSPGWAGANLWNAKSKGKSICGIGLGKRNWFCKESNFWVVTLNHLNHMDEYEDKIIKEGLQEIVWNNIRHCAYCSRCAPGKNIKICGKELKSVCKDSHLFIHDPDEAMVSGIKKLLELEKQARINGG